MTEQPIAEVLAQVMENLGPVAEAAAGYRTTLEGVGFSPAVAEHLAADFVCHMHRAAFGN